MIEAAEIAEMVGGVVSTTPSGGGGVCDVVFSVGVFIGDVGGDVEGAVVGVVEGGVEDGCVGGVV